MLKIIIATALIALSLPAYGQATSSARSDIAVTGNGATIGAGVANAHATIAPVTATTGAVTVNGTSDGGGDRPVSSAYAPSNSSSQCRFGISTGLQLKVVGFSAGGSFRDDDCNRERYFALLMKLGERQAAIAMICNNNEVRAAMGSKCPPLPAAPVTVAAAADDIEAADALGGD